METMHLLKKTLCACFLFMAAIPMSAQEGNAQDTEGHPSWYIGLQGGVPFGISTFGGDASYDDFSTTIYPGT